MLQSMGLKIVGYYWVTEQHQEALKLAKGLCF